MLLCDESGWTRSAFIFTFKSVPVPRHLITYVFAYDEIVIIITASIEHTIEQIQSDCLASG